MTEQIVYAAVFTGNRFRCISLFLLTLFAAFVIGESAVYSQCAILPPASPTGLTLTIIAAPTITPNVTQVAGGSGLVAQWKFDEGSGAVACDSSGNGNTATLGNGPLWTAGKVGNALYFDGVDDNLVVAASNSLNLSSSFTLSAWVNPASASTDFRSIVTKNYKYYLYASVAGYCGNGSPLGGVSGGAGHTVCHPSPLAINTWTHLAVTYDGSTLTLYRNSVAVATSNFSGTLSPSTGTLQIGASQYGEHFQGLIDEVRIYSRALSVTEIQAIYQQDSIDTSQTVAPPVISPNGGNYSGSVSVTMQTATTGASIYYTTDGSPPTQSSTLYAGPLTLTSSAIVKAKAFATGLNASSEASASFTVSQPFNFSISNTGDRSVNAGSSVTTSISAGLSSGITQSVSFSVSGLPMGATASFSAGSCSPSCSTVLTMSTTGSTPGGNFAITVMGAGGGVTKTTTFTLTIVLAVATPTISPNGGSFTGSVSATLQTATSGASIYYTTNGSTPTQASTLYTGAMTLTSSAVVKAKGFKSGYTPSSEASASFALAATGTVGSSYYISPAGSDSNSGTSPSSSWNTFAFAVTKLRPGDQLILLDGTYTMAGNGRIFIRCDSSGSAQNGTAASPITVKAQNERQAFLNGDGSALTIQVYRCSYWTFEGIRANSADHSSGNGGVVGTAYSDHLVFRRMLLQYNNRYGNTHLLSLTLGNYILIEENEFYETHRGGIVGSFDNSIIRRNYFNSRNFADIIGGYTSIRSQKGDESIAIYPGSYNIVENNISEGQATGFTIQALGTSDNNRFLGNISLSEDYAFGNKVRSNSSGSWSPTNTLFENSVALRPGIGIYSRGTFNTQVNNTSIISGSNIGIIADVEPGDIGGGVYSFYSLNTLTDSNSLYGFVMKHDFLIDYPNSFGSVTTFSPAPTDSRITNDLSADPQLGACKVFIPLNSPMKGAGKNGGDIGANVLYRYVNGKLTNQPLWNPLTGEFPHGAVIAGVNDIAGSSAFDVHKRLNVNANGCPLPAGYGG